MPSGHHRPPGVNAAVAASFPSMEAARVAIESLENAGIDGDDIELLGQPVEGARPPENPKRVDKRVASHLFPRVVAGVLIGAAIGAVLGLVLGLALAGTFSGLDGAPFVAAIILLGIGLGAVVGAFISFERSVGLSDAWPLTFQDVSEGPVWVAVYADDLRTRGRAAQRLADQDPLELRRGAA